MKFIGRTKRSIKDYQPSYFFENRFLSKNLRERNAKIEQEKKDEEKKKMK